MRNISLDLIKDDFLLFFKDRELLDVVLENIIKHLPAHIYWKDLDGRYQGSNDRQANSLGFKSATELIGKTDLELPWPQDAAVEFRNNDIEVMQSGAIKVVEEQTIMDGKDVTVLSYKIPLKNSQNAVIGILGLSLDITDRKEKEAEELRSQLILERHTLLQEQQKKFKDIIRRGAHDMRSPLAVLQMLIECSVQNLPANVRVDYQASFTRLLDIANEMLDYMGNPNADMFDVDVQAPVVRTILLAPEISSILVEKKYEYTRRQIRFISNMEPGSYFICANLDVKAFRRSISNIINNAVDALDNRDDGKVTIALTHNADIVQISVNDNGVGIPDDVRQNILDSVSVTANKVGGHGIGLGQVRDMLQNSHGELSIESMPNVGTTVTLSFCKTKPPAWLATQIKLKNNAIIIIVDDEVTAHSAWDVRFNIHKNKFGFHHFDDGDEAIDFLTQLSEEELQRAYLLVDYQLGSKECNGLDIIQRVNVAQKILVTNFYNDPLVLEAAASGNAFKILPKILINEISIQI